MPEPNSRISVSSEGDVTVVELMDRKILDEVSILHISEQLNSLIVDASAPRLVVDFTNVDHLSSSALGMLITLHNCVREKAGRLVLCNIQPGIYEVFAITRLNDIFTIRNSRAEALAEMD